jgi:phage FluMu protein Com
MVKKFQRTIENFVCENCGYEVLGNGYTDHCPRCLYSKHVDINPGDRSNECEGLMKPIDLEIKHGKYVIIYECSKCKEIHRVKVVEEDDMNVLLELK